MIDGRASHSRQQAPLSAFGVRALYAFAAATNSNVLCLAHVTNTMAQSGADFEKGEDDGTVDALAVLGAIIGAWAEG
jgi:hypothetical protein